MRWRWLVPIFVAALVSSITANVLTTQLVRDRFEKEAVQAGAARWVFDEAGDPHFEWRKP